MLSNTDEFFEGTNIYLETYFINDSYLLAQDKPLEQW